MKSWWKASLLVLFCLAILSSQGGMVLAKPVALDGDPIGVNAQHAEGPNAWDLSALSNFPAAQPAQSETTTAPLSVAALPVGLIDYWKADEASGVLLGASAGKTFNVFDSVGSNTGKVYATAREYGGPGTAGKHGRNERRCPFWRCRLHRGRLVVSIRDAGWHSADAVSLHCAAGRLQRWLHHRFERRLSTIFHVRPRRKRY